MLRRHASHVPPSFDTARSPCSATGLHVPPVVSPTGGPLGNPVPHLRVMLRAVLLLVVVSLGTACGSQDPGTDRGTAGAPGSTAPASGTDEVEPTRGGELVVALSAETNDWNPVVGQWASSGGIVARAVYDPLAVVDANGEVQPYLARSFEADDDFTTWTITVRDGVTFHDGTPLDGVAVARNLEERRTAALTASTYAGIEEVEVVDGHTVRVSTSAPWSTFPLTMTGQGGYVAATATLDDPEGGSRPIGTGPFAFVSWVRDADLVVERNERYWRTDEAGEALPRLDRVRFRVLADDTTRSNAFAAGEVDVIEVVDAARLGRLEERARMGEVALGVDRGLSTSLVVLNTAAPPFDDPLARRAVAHAIDPARISETVYQGVFAPADGPLQPSALGYLPPEETGYPRPDPVRATELAREYERTRGAPLRFTYLSLGDPTSRDLATTLQASLQEVGIEMEVEIVDQTAAILDVVSGAYQASYYASRAVPSLDVAYSLYASEPAPLGSLSPNVARVDSPELRAALAEARTTDDPDLQAAAYGDAQVAIADALGWLYLAHDVNAVAAATDVRGMQDTRVPGTDVGASYFATLPFLTEVWISE